MNLWTKIESKPLAETKSDRMGELRIRALTDGVVEILVSGFMPSKHHVKAGVKCDILVLPDIDVRVTFWDAKSGTKSTFPVVNVASGEHCIVMCCASPW